MVKYVSGLFILMVLIEERKEKIRKAKRAKRKREKAERKKAKKKEGESKYAEKKEKEEKINKKISKNEDNFVPYINPNNNINAGQTLFNKIIDYFEFCKNNRKHGLSFF